MSNFNELVELNPHVLVLNIQCLNYSKVLYIESIICKLSNLKFICLSETWANEICLQSFNFAGFSLITYFCRKEYRGGGVAIWSKVNCRVAPLDLSNYISEKNIEVCGLELTVHSKKLFLFMYYRSPSGSVDAFMSTLERMLHDFHDIRCSYVLAGDFNIDFGSYSQPMCDLMNLFATFNMKHCVVTPTRVQHASATIIDNVFTNLDSVGHVNVVDCHISDHRMLFFVLPLFVSDASVKCRHVVRNFSDRNILNFVRMLDNVLWDELYKFDNANFAFNYFYSVFMKHFDACFPFVEKCERDKNKCWVSSEVRRSSEGIRDLYVLQKKFPVLKELYLVQKNNHNDLLRSTKRNYYTNKITKSSNQVKTTWDVINELSGKSKNFDNIVLNENGTIINDQNHIAEALNKYFIDSVHGVVSKISSSSVTVDNDNRTGFPSMCALPLSEFETRD